MASDHTINTPGFDARIDPSAFQHYAKDFYDAHKKHKSGPKFSPARFFMLARSIELAAKALHLGRGRNAYYLRRKIGHDLVKACKSTVLASYGITLSTAEKAELKKANRYYKIKGFEYFLFSLQGAKKKRKGFVYFLFGRRGGAKKDEDRSGHELALGGWPDLPDESTLETIVTKLLTPKLNKEPRRSGAIK